MSDIDLRSFYKLLNIFIFFRKYFTIVDITDILKALSIDSSREDIIKMFGNEYDNVTKYDVTASTEAEKERIDEWHKYLNEDDDGAGT